MTDAGARAREALHETWQRLEARLFYEPNSGCWLWSGSCWGEAGHGRIWMQRRHWLTHRVSFMRHRGEIPNGLHVCHKCDVPICVNPDHLFLGTATDNFLDASRKGRLASAATHPEWYAQTRESARARGKLSMNQAMAIRVDRRPTRVLAASFGVAMSTIQRIRNGEAWKPLPPEEGR